MRRPKPPKLCRNPDGRGFVILPGTGKRRKYLGRYGTEECDEAYKLFLREWASDSPPSAAPVKPKLVLHLVDKFLDHSKEYHGPQSIGPSVARMASFRYSVVRHLKN